MNKISHQEGTIYHMQMIFQIMVIINIFHIQLTKSSYFFNEKANIYRIKIIFLDFLSSISPEMNYYWS